MLFKHAGSKGEEKLCHNAVHSGGRLRIKKGGWGGVTEIISWLGQRYFLLLMYRIHHVFVSILCPVQASLVITKITTFT